MATTNLDTVNAVVRIKLASALDLDPADFYGTSNNDVNPATWQGGELIFNTADNRLYIQRSTSGTTAAWRQLSEQFQAV